MIIIYMTIMLTKLHFKKNEFEFLPLSSKFGCTFLLGFQLFKTFFVGWGRGQGVGYNVDISLKDSKWDDVFFTMYLLSVCISLYNENEGCHVTCLFRLPDIFGTSLSISLKRGSLSVDVGAVSSRAGYIILTCSSVLTSK